MYTNQWKKKKCLTITLQFIEAFSFYDEVSSSKAGEGGEEEKENKSIFFF